MKLRVDGSLSFTYVDAIMLDEGPYAGHMAVILQPTRPFPLEKLPVEIRRIIFQHVLAPQGHDKSKIHVKSCTVQGMSAAVSKDFAEGMKHRVAAVRLNKEVRYLIPASMLPMLIVPSCTQRRSLSSTATASDSTTQPPS